MAARYGVGHCKLANPDTDHHDNRNSDRRFSEKLITGKIQMYGCTAA